MVNIPKAITAPARFTTDSTASDNRPTDPVNIYAMVFNAIVDNAAAIDSQAKRVNLDRSKGIIVVCSGVDFT